MQSKRLTRKEKEEKKIKMTVIKFKNKDKNGNFPIYFSK